MLRPMRKILPAHVFDWPDPALVLPSLPSSVRSARLLDGGTPVEFKTGDGGVILTLPADVRDPIDTSVVLELEPRASR